MQKSLTKIILLNTCILASCTTTNIQIENLTQEINSQIETVLNEIDQTQTQSQSHETQNAKDNSQNNTTSNNNNSQISTSSIDDNDASVHKISRQINAFGIKDKESLYEFFIHKAPDAPKLKAKKIAKIYIEECQDEGINSDVAFVQMCLETNFLRYGNLVKKEWNNFCGLGAIDKDNPGLKFSSIRKGVRAHVQHLHAYGTTKDVALKNELIDPRYKYVNPRGKAKDIYGLSGTWASDKEYANKLEKFLQLLEGF